MAKDALQLLLIAIIVCMYAAVAAVGERTGYVSQGGAGANTTTLVEALKDQTITTIVLTTDYDIGHEFNSNLSPQSPIVVNRNVSIIGVAGQPMPLWNLRFQRASVELCASCSCTLDSIAIANERRGNGAAVDLFVGAQGEPGAVLATLNLFRLRPACTSTASTLELIRKGQQRSSRFSAGQGPQQQLLDVVNVTFRGVDYTNMMLLEDFVYDVPPAFQEALGSVGGYTLLVRNTTRICTHILSGDCLMVKSPDACVNDLIDELLAQEAGHSKQHSSALIPVVVAVPAAAVIAAVAASLLWRRHRRRQAGAAGQQAAGSKDVLQGGSDPEKGTAAPRADAAPAPAAPLLDTRGWDVANSRTAAALGPLQDADIQLGMMIGAGSFGRVYKGRWAGQDVAVKVIEHGSESAVENEVQLMLSINHPNVVRAYHYITYTSKAVPAEASLPGAAGGGRRAPAGRLPGLKGHRLQAGGAAAASTPSQPGSTGNSKTTHSSSAHTPTSAACSQAEASPQQPRDAASQQYAAKLSALKQVLRPGNAQQSQQQQLHSEMQQQPRRASEVGSGQDNSLGQHALAHTLGSDTPHTADQAAQQQQQQQHGLQPGGCAAAGLRQSPPHVCPSAGDSWARDSRPFPVSATSGLHAGLDSSQLQRTPGGTLSVMLRSRTWLVQELCDCGTLCSWVGDTALGDGNTEQELQLLLLLQDAARGVAHLHSRSIVHGDLNARNVLVRSADGGGVVAKLADLGISRVIKQHSTHRTTNTVGTMSHMPPELLRYGRMSPAVDVYAFGVMMWELYTGKIAFKHLHYGQFFEQVVLRNNRPPLPPLMPEDYSLLLTSCWAMDPAARPCIAAVLDCLKLMIQERQLNI